MKPPPDDFDSRGGWSDPGSGEGSSASEAFSAPTGPRYQVGARPGEGGMGVVLTARDAVLGRDVALKAERLEATLGSAGRARLMREAALTSRLDHPGIMTVHDAGVLPDGRSFYAMRLVRGHTLADALAEHLDPTARRRLVRAVLAAAEAVAAAHDTGIVHRDLKPSNILLGPHGETQVADWGLAVPTTEAAPRWTDLTGTSATGSVGTPGYSAPEQVRGAPAEPHHDVYSLGRTLHAVLGGDPSPELTAVVQRATHPDPSLRYPNAGAFAEDLLAWFEGRQVHAYRYSAGELLRRALWAWRWPLGVGSIGLVAVLVAVLVGWWQTHQSLERALAAEALAAHALADVRIEEATRAALDGDRQLAEDLAHKVLQHRETPSHGVFSRPSVAPPAPSCGGSTPAPPAASPPSPPTAAVRCAAPKTPCSTSKSTALAGPSKSAEKPRRWKRTARWSCGLPTARSWCSAAPTATSSTAGPRPSATGPPAAAPA